MTNSDLDRIDSYGGQSSRRLSDCVTPNKKSRRGSTSPQSSIHYGNEVQRSKSDYTGRDRISLDVNTDAKQRQYLRSRKGANKSDGRRQFQKSFSDDNSVNRYEEMDRPKTRLSMRRGENNYLLDDGVDFDLNREKTSLGMPRPKSAGQALIYADLSDDSSLDGDIEVVDLENDISDDLIVIKDKEKQSKKKSSRLKHKEVGEFCNKIDYKRNLNTRFHGNSENRYQQTNENDISTKDSDRRLNGSRFIDRDKQRPIAVREDTYFRKHFTADMPSSKHPLFRQHQPRSTMPARQIRTQGDFYETTAEKMIAKYSKLSLLNDSDNKLLSKRESDVSVPSSHVRPSKLDPIPRRNINVKGYKT